MCIVTKWREDTMEEKEEMSLNEKIIKKFAPKFYLSYQTYKNQCLEYRQKIQEMKIQNSRLNSIIKTVNKVAERQDTVLEIKEDGFVIFKEFDGSIVMSRNINPYSNWQAKISCCWNLEAKKVYICDNHANPPCQGYGSKAMQALFKEANNVGIKTITGWLSPHDTGDEEHGAMLRHFYKKHGFHITIRDGKEIVVKELTGK
jgi:hypothetical protein